MERLLCLIIGYVFGLFQTAYIYGRLNGIDIREHGSGNSGTTNALRTLGAKAGAIVLFGDALKCGLAILLCDLLFSGSNPEMSYLIKIYAGAGAILGHNFPFYLRFRGGKGIASTAGLIIAFHPWFFLVGLVTFFSTFFITHYVSLGSLLVYVAFCIQMVVFGQSGFFGEISPAHLYELYGVTAFLAAMAVFKHRGNIARLAKGEERKTYLKKKKDE